VTRRAELVGEMMQTYQEANAAAYKIIIDRLDLKKRKQLPWIIKDKYDRSPPSTATAGTSGR
jgi:hypothetical protein